MNRLRVAVALIPTILEIPMIEWWEKLENINQLGEYWIGFINTHAEASCAEPW